ncbi:MAG TPA: hypothetical protein EYF99_07930 [Pseudomonadales bacterium]|nr:hypothetical protein [Pseudomonadales bacterium]
MAYGVLEALNASLNSESQTYYGLSLLLFLPHGIRVFATYFMGFRALPPLLIGQLICLQLFPHPGNSLAMCLVGASCAPLAFEIFRQADIRLYHSKGAQSLNWRALLLVGIIASLINDIGSRLILSVDAPAALFSPSYFLFFMLGDIAGLIVCIVIFQIIVHQLQAKTH